MKRVVAVLALVGVVAVILYGYTMTRRERLYRRAVLEGELALARGDAFGAISHFGEAIGFKPDAMLGYLKRGEAHFRRGELEDAARDFATASQRDPAATRALELRGDLELARSRPREAAEHYAAFVRLDDRAPRILYKLGLANILMGQPAAATEVLNRSVGLDPRLADAHYLLGMCLRDLQRPRDAQRALERAVSLAPSLLPAREQLADLYASSGNRSGRIRQLEALFDADPRPGRQLALARAYADANQTARAVRLLGHATERYPDHAETYVALGRVWLEEARGGDAIALGKALEALEHAVSMEPTSRALGLLGEARLFAADPNLAIVSLQQAAGKLPANRATFLDLADAANRAGRLAEARDALLDYFSLSSPSDRRRSDIAERIGELSLRLNDTPAARAWYSTAASQPATAQELLSIARTQLRIGDRSGAETTLDRLLEKEPGMDEARALRSTVR